MGPTIDPMRGDAVGTREHSVQADRGGLGWGGRLLECCDFVATCIVQHDALRWGIKQAAGQGFADGRCCRNSPRFGENFGHATQRH